MKRLALTLALFIPLLHPALAGSIPKEEIADNAKWLIHLDAAQFRASKIGGFVLSELLDKQLAVPVKRLDDQFRLDIDVNKVITGINSVTIYGTDYDSPQAHAVLLIRTGPELEKIVVGVLAGMALAGTNAPVPVTQTDVAGLAFYAIKDTGYCAVLPGKTIAFGRSREVTENAANVLGGKAPSLPSGKLFGGFEDMKEAFFFVGVAEGFGLGNKLPPQAKLLQVADAGRVVLGETADQLFLNLALRGKTQETVAQMQQVMQGLIAIGSLSQPQDKDVAQLLQSIKVSTNGNIVNVRVDYPISGALDHLTQTRNNMLRKPDQTLDAAGSENPPLPPSNPLPPVTH